ncbi:MAG: HNH endonuclease signature motif containing protein [Acidimicrobiales bacterium]
MPFRSEVLGHGPVDPDTLRRMCCNADITRIVMRGPSEVLDVGKAQRLATPAIRTAVWARSGGWCEVCHLVKLTWCQVHHIVPWDPAAGDGPTSVENSALVCNHCHRLLHEGATRSAGVPTGSCWWGRTAGSWRNGCDTAHAAPLPPATAPHRVARPEPGWRAPPSLCLRRPPSCPPCRTAGANCLCPGAGVGAPPACRQLAGVARRVRGPWWATRLGGGGPPASR